MKKYNNLINLLNLFKDRPNHLADFLLENKAFNKTFLDKIEKNDKIKKSEEKDFNSILEMNEYYNSLIQNIDMKKMTESELEEYYNDRLVFLIKEEKYEEAAKIRDYMTKNKIKKRNIL